jgi:hypothetical protein
VDQHTVLGIESPCHCPSLTKAQYTQLTEHFGTNAAATLLPAHPLLAILGIVSYTFSRPIPQVAGPLVRRGEV